MTAGRPLIADNALEVLSEAKAGIQRQVLSRLRLSVGEAARVSGVTVRQLSYWTDKGLVKATGLSGKKRYDFRALERIALIKRALNEGYSLEEAAAHVASALKTKTLPPGDARHVILDRLGELEELVSRIRLQLTQTSAETPVADSAKQLLQLNIRALFAEKPDTRASADELAQELGRARDQVRAALDALVDQGTLRRQGRTYRRS